MITAILFDVIGPIIVMIAVGALLHRTLKFDMGTLSKLNIYFAVPAFIFSKVAYSSLPFSDMGGIVAITVIQMTTLGLLVYAVGKLFRVGPTTLGAMVMAVIFYNSGNYGLPLAELAYPAKSTAAGGGRSGAAVQAFVVMTQNLLSWTAGLAIAASFHAGFKWGNLKRIFQLPMIPAMLAGIACKAWLAGDPARALPIIIAKPTQYVTDTCVPLALLTLGAQLASNSRWPRWKPVSAVLAFRLVLGPIQMGLILYGLHALGWRPLDLWGGDGWPAELLILTAAVPTAITTLLLTLEIGGDVELAADCVFWTTICSCVSIPIWLYLVWWFFGTVPAS